MNNYSSACEALDMAAFETFKPFCAIDQAFADAMNDVAQPHAISALGDQARLHVVDGQLPVVVHVVPAVEGKFGQLMPALPVTDLRPVPISILENWGLALFLQRATVGEPAQASAKVDGLFRDRSRIRIGITNDVLQGFVRDPPSNYSFVRHHALMLFLATLWLPEPQRRGWFEIFHLCSRTLCDECGLHHKADPLGWLEATARAGAQILGEYGPATRDDEGVASFLQNGPVLAEYLPYLGATSLAVAALAHQHDLCPSDERQAWRTRQVSAGHAEPDFNTTWILEYLETLP